MTNSCINHKLCIWKWEVILWARSIQVSKIITNLNLSIFPFDRDNVCNPLWELYFPDESCPLEFVNFCLNLWEEFGSKAALGLLDWHTPCFIAIQ